MAVVAIVAVMVIVRSFSMGHDGTTWVVQAR